MIPKEIIKEKWVEIIGEDDFNLIDIDEEGWLNLNNTKDYHYYNNVYGCNKFTSKGYNPFKTGEYSYLQDVSIRPYSLKGFENNKGWIKIESEEELPQVGERYWVIKKGKIDIGTYVFSGWICSGKYYLDTSKNLNITHYQPMQKPELPLH